MGCVHSCAIAIEESSEEGDNSNNVKGQEKKRTKLVINTSFEKGSKSWDLDSKEAESSFKGNKFKDVAKPALKDTNSKADKPSFLAKARGTGFFGPGTSSSAPKPVHRNGKMSILCFEAANTIFKGAKLMESLSDENVKHYKEIVLLSQGTQRLISDDMGVLLNLAASDKRKELEVLSREVIRFGNKCRDPQFHSLEHYFARFELEMPQSCLQEIARRAMEDLLILAQRTSKLYLEMYVLMKFEQDYKKKCDEEQKSIYSQKGDRAKDLKQQIDNQKGYIKDLRKETLWSKKIEEVVGKLVDIIQFIHFEINRVFDVEDGDRIEQKQINSSETLSSAGLALHYAHIITKIDNVFILQRSVPQTLREELYMSLPNNIRASLKPKLLSLHPSEFSTKQIRRELDKILRWLLPMANNTVKAQFGFGWVSEIASIRSEANDGVVVEPNMTRLQTLDHARREKVEEVILELLVWLQRLIIKNMNGSGTIQTQFPTDPQSNRKFAIDKKRSKNGKDT